MPPEQIPFRFFSSKTLIFFISIVIIAGIYLALWQRQTSHQQLTFSSKTQFVPQGAQSREVDQSLAAFGFPKPLPFFDKDNVVQSLELGTQVIDSTTHSSAFLSYQVFGQGKAAIRNATKEYFQNMGWKITNTQEDGPLIFSSASQKIISVVFLDGPPVQDLDQPVIVVALTVQ